LNSDHDSELDNRWSRQASPDGGIAGWPIMDAGKIAAESCQLDNVMGEFSAALRI
jgi:hypothetical protein